MHKEGYAHNDIKPDNILLKNNKAKVTDLGLCKPIDAPFKGFKKIYAPEQKGVEDKVGNEKTDVYQFGLLMWHLFHPNPPFDHLEESFKYPEDIHEMFANWTITTSQDKLIQMLISSCLSKDPSKRPSMENINKYLIVIQKKLTQ